jgi:hypothetical protein
MAEYIMQVLNNVLKNQMFPQQSIIAQHISPAVTSRAEMEELNKSANSGNNDSNNNNGLFTTTTCSTTSSHLIRFKLFHPSTDDSQGSGII